MKFVKNIAGNAFLRQNAVLVFGAVAVGVLNYLFYPVVGRLLSPAAFGEVQAIFSLFLQLTIFLTVLSMTTVFIVANYKNAVSRNTAVLELEKLSVWTAIGLLIIALLAGSWLQSFFRFESPAPFAVLAILLAVSVPLTFRAAFLRGKKLFLASVISTIFSAAGRFVFAVPLVLIGLGSSGALAGVALGQAAALVYTVGKARTAGLTRPAGIGLFTKPSVSTLWPEIKYSLWVLAGSLALMLQLTVDALVVKHLFDAHTAGLYAGVVTVARIIFFLTVPVVAGLLPNVKINAPVAANRGQLFKSLVLCAVISLPLLAAMTVSPTLVVTLLMGHQYAPVAGLLPLLAFTTFIISGLNVVVSYFLALKRYAYALLGIIGLAATFVLMFFHHGSLQAIVESLFVGSLASVCLIAIWLIASARLTSRRSIDETTTTFDRGAGTQ